MRRPRPRALLLVKARLAAPVEIGSDAVSYALWSALREAFAVTVLAVDDGERSRTGADQLRGLGIEVMLVPAHRTLAAGPSLAGALIRNVRRLALGVPVEYQRARCARLARALTELTRRRTFALAQFEYWTLARYRRHARCPAALLNHDVWFRTVAGIARHQRSAFRRLLWRLEARATERYEVAANRLFESCLFLSEDDRRLMGERAPGLRADVLPVLLPFEPVAPGSSRAASGPPLILFVGAMGAPFNIAAVREFVEGVWPMVRREVPDAWFAIAGRDPAPEVRALDTHPGVRVVGEVGDPRPLLRQAWVAVSPGRIGTGIKVKVGLAIAAGLPVVGTSSGLAGYPATEGLIRTDEPDETAHHLVRLLRDASARTRLGRAARESYVEHFWLESGRDRVIAFYERLLGSLPSGGRERADGGLLPGDRNAHPRRFSWLRAARPNE